MENRLRNQGGGGSTEELLQLKLTITELQKEEISASTFCHMLDLVAVVGDRILAQQPT